MTAKTALICVDVQRDFLPGGALAVPDGDAVVGPLLELAKVADFVVASKDWHPPTHCSFVKWGGPWPAHCVAETAGAKLHPDIDAVAELVVGKGTLRDADAYSAFDGTGLAHWLKGNGVTRVIVGGLATDYCVKATALDAVAAGFDTTVVFDACRAVSEASGAAALSEMGRAGVKVTALDG